MKRAVVLGVLIGAGALSIAVTAGQDVRAARAAGRTVEDVAGSWTIPARYAGYAAPRPDRLRSNVQVVYDELAAGGSR